MKGFTMNSKTLRAGLLLNLLTPVLAQAHNGNPHIHSSFMSGLAHPLTGWDHLALIIAVGVWAAQQGRSSRVNPLWVFVCSLILGGILAMAGLALPGLEVGILASVGVMGGLLLWRGRVPMVAVQGAIGFFALLHGFAHGLESSAVNVTQTVSYGLGFTLSTAALLFASRAVTIQLRSHHLLTLNRSLGAILTLAAVVGLSV